MSPPDISSEENSDHDSTRARIISATAALIAEDGLDAATTRAIALAADVQAPTIYRLFGDKGGLLEAVMEQGYADYMAEKSAKEPHPDPVQDLRDGWDSHIAFGINNPELIWIMSASPRNHSMTPAISRGLEVLKRRVKAAAIAGKLRVSESRAITMLQSFGLGTVLTLIGRPNDEAHQDFSIAAREAVMASITTDKGLAPKIDSQIAAASLLACLDQTPVLSKGEKHLMTELLERIANSK